MDNTNIIIWLINIPIFLFVLITITVVTFLTNKQKKWKKENRKKITISLEYYFDFNSSQSIYLDCQKIKWSEHKYMNLSKHFPKFRYSNYLFNNNIDKNLELMKAKIKRMENHFNKMEQTIYNFNFKKIYHEEHIENIKFVHSCMNISHTSNCAKIVDFDEMLVSDEGNYFLEQFDLTYENNEIIPRSTRIFHLFVSNGNEFILYPLFIDFNHQICTKKKKVKLKND